MPTTKKTAKKTRKPITFSADGVVTLDCTFEIEITDRIYDADNLIDDIDAGRVTTSYGRNMECDLLFKPEGGEARRIGRVSLCLCEPEEDSLQQAGLYNFFKLT